MKMTLDHGNQFFGSLCHSEGADAIMGIRTPGARSRGNENGLPRFARNDGLREKASKGTVRHAWYTCPTNAPETFGENVGVST